MSSNDESNKDEFNLLKILLNYDQLHQVDILTFRCIKKNRYFSDLMKIFRYESWLSLITLFADQYLFYYCYTF